MRLFIALVLMLVVAGSSQAQFAQYVPQQSTCANGRCGVVQSAAIAVGNTFQNVGQAITNFAAPSTCANGRCGVPQTSQYQVAQASYSQPAVVTYQAAPQQTVTYQTAEPQRQYLFAPFGGKFRVFRR